MYHRASCIGILASGGHQDRVQMDTPLKGTSPNTPPHPTSSGFPAPSCRLYFIATSGVCLFPQAPLVFPSKRLHSQNKTKTRVGDITVSVGYEYSEGGKCDGDVVGCERVPYRPSRSLMRSRTAPQSFHIHARRADRSNG